MGNHSWEDRDETGHTEVDVHGDDERIDRAPDGPDADEAPNDDEAPDDDGVGLFREESVDGAGHPRHGRVRRGIVKGLWAIVALVVLTAIVAGVVFGVVWWRDRNAQPTDWAGTGATVAVIRVQSGDGLAQVGETLVAAGAVADAHTFVEAAQASGKLSGLQPGYYAVHLHSSAKVVVGELADPDARLGQLRIIPGQTLADITKVSTSGKTSTKQGILSAIVDACVPTDGDKACFSVDDLWAVEKTATPSQLGVVAWAVDAVDRAPDPRRRLEGLILPGDYDIAPGSTAREALASVVRASAARWNTTAIVASAKQQDLTPYQLATVASLVQAEAVGSDMRKVARVIYNRLADEMKLQFDSTVNYGLDRAQIATTNSERLDPDNLYSTYAHPGLTPTPIGAPGPKAVDAAADPAVGDWLYFVTVNLDGTTCFSATAAEHQKCVDKARANGVFG